MKNFSNFLEINNTSRFFCRNITADYVFIVLTLVLFLLTTFSFSNTVILFKSFFRNSFIPANIQTVLYRYCIAKIVFSICFFIRTIYHFMLIIYGFERFSVSRILCLIIEIPFMVSASCISLSLVALSVERFLTALSDYISNDFFNSTSFAKILPIYLGF